jgi:hypothetical protein
MLIRLVPQLQSLGDRHGYLTAVNSQYVTFKFNHNLIDWNDSLKSDSEGFINFYHPRLNPIHNLENYGIHFNIFFILAWASLIASLQLVYIIYVIFLYSVYMT